MKKFTKRDFKFFFLGVLAMIAVETIYDGTVLREI